MRTDVRAGSSLAAVRKALVSIGWISPAPPSSLCLATVVSHWFLGSPSSFLSCLGKDRFSSPHFLQPPFPFTDYLPLKCLSIFQTWLSLDPWHGFFVERNQSPRIWRHERASTMRNEHNSCFFQVCQLNISILPPCFRTGMMTNFDLTCDRQFLRFTRTSTLENQIDEIK